MVAYKLSVCLQLVGSCEHDNESSGSIKGREFLDQLSDC